jgi:pyridoxamine 5'-phosphate oxidase family protein
VAFTEEEVAYLKSQPLARIATVGADEQPDVAPVGFEFDGTYFYVDDLVSTNPWTPRFLRVYGTAELIERPGQFGSGRYLKITPDISWSWNLEGRPFGDDGPQSGPRRTVHR